MKNNLTVWKSVLVMSFFVCCSMNVILAQNLVLKNETQVFSINPENLSIYFLQKNVSVLVAQGESQEVKNLKVSQEQLSWKTNTHQVTVGIKENYLQINIQPQDTGAFVFPRIQQGVSAYVLPIMGMGKYIPSDDKNWIAHLRGQEYKGLETLSMQFFSTYYPDFSSTFIIENPFNNKLKFGETNEGLSLSFKHETPITARNRIFSYRIYIDKCSVESIAHHYKGYLQEKGMFKTFQDKVKENKNIAKLFGAPHIYVWDNEFLTLSSIIDWDNFQNYFANQITAPKNNVTKLLLEKLQALGDREEWGKVWGKLDQPISLYEKGIFLQSLNYLINKELISRQNFLQAYGQFFNTDFGNGNSLYLMNQLYTSGIKKAWIGLSDWAGGVHVPEFVDRANYLGYLVAPYDSYHSIHEPKKEKWRTAQYQDSTLYEKATVTDKSGEKIVGFLGTGRKLNPFFSFGEVLYRLNLITENIHFNSWFIDCDAAGDIVDDYTPDRMSNEQEDLQARLGRMQLIEKKYEMVIGSEGGNDYAAKTIAFAHGMLTPNIFGDEEMTKDKKSPFFLGDYSTFETNIPSINNKMIPLKPKYLYLYYDMRFNIPLYQLVYNNSVIATHQWGWGTFRVKSEVRNNELKEILYNVPPLYHLDRHEWKKRKNEIVSHVKEMSSLHEKLVQMEMTDFTWLSKDRLVQKTTFSSEKDKVEIIANFSDKPFLYKGITVVSKAYKVL